MNKIFFIFAFVLASCSFIHAQTFSGIIMFETENFEAGEKSSITCYVKPHLCKMEIQSSAKEGSTSYTLYFDDEKMDVVMISNGNKTLIPVNSLPANKYIENILVAIPSGGSQNIAGYEAKEINLKSTHAIIRCLVASELNIEFPVVLNNKGVIKALRENNIKGTPVLMEAKDLSGKPVYSQKIVSVSAQNLDDAVFSVE